MLKSADFSPLSPEVKAFLVIAPYFYYLKPSSSSLDSSFSPRMRNFVSASDEGTGLEHFLWSEHFKDYLLQLLSSIALPKGKNPF